MSPRQLSRRKRIAFTFVLIVGLFVLTLAIDATLGLAGFPDHAYQVAPPHYTREVTNLEFSYRLETNDMGIRYPTVPLAKPSGTIRVVLLGDSFTDGTGVAENQRWSTRLEDVYRQEGKTIELINCGEAGTGPVDYFQTLEQIGIRYQPDAVVVGLYHNDLSNAPLEPPPMRSTVRRWASSLWPRMYTLVRSAASQKSAQGLGTVSVLDAVKDNVKTLRISDTRYEQWLQAVPDDLLEEAEQRKLNFFTLTYPLIRPKYYHGSLMLDDDRSRKQFDTVMVLIDRMHTYCEKRDVRFGLILFPCVYQYDTQALDRVEAKLYETMETPLASEWTQSTPLEQQLAASCTKRGIPFLNLAEDFRQIEHADEQLSGKLNYDVDVHWTPAGHAAAVEPIRHWLDAFISP